MLFNKTRKYNIQFSMTRQSILERLAVCVCVCVQNRTIILVRRSIYIIFYYAWFKSMNVQNSIKIIIITTQTRNV